MDFQTTLHMLSLIPRTSKMNFASVSAQNIRQCQASMFLHQLLQEIPW